MFIMVSLIVFMLNCGDVVDEDEGLLVVLFVIVFEFVGVIFDEFLLVVVFFVDVLSSWKVELGFGWMIVGMIDLVRDLGWFCEGIFDVERCLCVLFGEIVDDGCDSYLFGIEVVVNLEFCNMEIIYEFFFVYEVEFWLGGEIVKFGFELMVGVVESGF